MIAVSSFRRLSDNEEVARNQMAAKASWETVFDGIIYLGDFEPLLASKKTEFLPTEDFPLMSTVLMTAAMCEDFVCVLNADIVVAPHLEQVIREVYGLGGRAVVSKRWNFSPTRSPQITDQGIDFFGTEPQFWAQAATRIPRHYRIGANCWDTWVMSYLNYALPRQFFDISSRAAIFHPEHVERKRLYAVEPIDDKYTEHCGWPLLKL